MKIRRQERVGYDDNCMACQCWPIGQFWLVLCNQSNFYLVTIYRNGPIRTLSTGRMCVCVGGGGGAMAAIASFGIFFMFIIHRNSE